MSEPTDPVARPVDAYVSVARDSPSDVALGGALITMIMPNPGHELEYNRWYEDDHFYAGATAGPWTFAGRRWAAPWSLRRKQLPATSPLFGPEDPGGYVSTYWVTQAHVEDNRRWSVATMFDEIMPAGRTFSERTSVYTAFHEHVFNVVFDAPPMRAVHALDHPYAGLALEIVKAETPEDRARLLEWLEHDFVPRARDRAPRAGQCVAFLPLPNLAETVAHIKPDPVDMTCCVCLLWFLTDAPTENWPGHFAAHEADIRENGAATLLMIAPFIPTVVGTDRYVDEMRRPEPAGAAD